MDSKYEGNAAMMREALIEISKIADDWESIAFTKAGALDSIYELANAALAAPPRNCDVGTPKEQEARWNDYCDDVTRGNCPPSAGCKSCALYWAQMPYKAEEGEIK